MDQSILVSGKIRKDVERESNIGQMDLFMKDTGIMILPKEREDKFMLMVMLMMVIGLMIDPKVMVYIIMSMVLNMKVSGTKINNMEKEQKYGLMEHITMDHMLMERRMERVSSNGAMVLLMKEILRIIILKVIKIIN